MKPIPLGRVASTALAVAAVAAVSACAAPAPPVSIDTLRIAVRPASFMTQNWDPVAGPSGWTYWFPSSQPVYESLVSLNPETIEHDPVLAEGYRISDDRRTITFAIREGVVFTDGERLDAAAVAKNLEVITAPFGADEYEVEILGEYELSVSFAKPIDMALMNAFGMLPIVSPVALDDLESLASMPVGTGPYVLEELVPEQSSTYVRNPDHWNPDAYPFDSLEFIAFDEEIAAANALKSGEIDAAEIGASLVADLEASGFRVSSGGGTVMTLIWMDRDGSVQPALADTRVRQAISHAFDRDAIRDLIDHGYGVSSSQAFVEGLPEHIEGGDDRYPYDLEKARELMADAGYADGFEITMPTGQLDMSYNAIIEQTLADLGITVTWKQYADYGEWAAALASGDYPLVPLGISDVNWVANLAPGGFLAGYPGQTPPRTDPRIADTIATILGGTPEESATASQELGEFLLEQQWYIPISRKLDTWATIPDIQIEIGRVYWSIQLRNISLAD